MDCQNKMCSVTDRSSIGFNDDIILHQKQPCIRLARGKFKLTNQESAGGKKIYCPHVNVR